jgi:hypothetical protein
LPSRAEFDAESAAEYVEALREKGRATKFRDSYRTVDDRAEMKFAATGDIRGRFETHRR